MIDSYHGNKKDEGKASVLKRLKQRDGELRCIVSTVAFGMGIDIPDIYRVIIWGCPSTIDSFWQECGRAGRDGITRSITTMYALRNKRKHADESMKELLQKAENESVCVRHFILNFLRLPGMELPPTNVSVCTLGCKECECAGCLCCNVCRKKCPCRKEINEPWLC